MYKFSVKAFLFFLICLMQSPITANSQDFPLAIRMMESKIIRYVPNVPAPPPQDSIDKYLEELKTEWDSVEIEEQNASEAGKIEYKIKCTTTIKNMNTTTTRTMRTTKTIYDVNHLFNERLNDRLNRLKNTVVAIFGPLGGPNEDLSAYNAEKLIAQCKEWYINDPDYHKIIDLLEKEVITKLKYDWDDFLGIEKHTYQQAIRLGLGVCDVYAGLVKEVLTKAGYRVEKWSSSRGNHAWNQVIMPSGKILYIDATWYDNCYENHPTQKSTDSYAPWYITYNKSFFEHGYLGTINMHGGWPDARKVE